MSSANDICRLDVYGVDNVVKFNNKKKGTNNVPLLKTRNEISFFFQFEIEPDLFNKMNANVNFPNTAKFHI